MLTWSGEAYRMLKYQPFSDCKIVFLTLLKHQKIKDSLIRPTFSINQMFQFDRSVLMFRIVNKICPESLHDKFAERSSISKYDTRNKTDLQIPRLNLEFNRKSFDDVVLKTWNSIPTYIRESNTLNRFKNGLKNHFLSWRKIFYAWIHGKTVLVFISVYVTY